MAREQGAASWLYIGRGLYLATLLLVLSPTPSLGGGFTDEGALVATRFAFFCALACSACLTTLLYRRLSPARLHSGVIVAAMAVEIVGGSATRSRPPACFRSSSSPSTYCCRPSCCRSSTWHGARRTRSCPCAPSSAAPPARSRLPSSCSRSCRCCRPHGRSRS
ncbi:hypothetical protein [Eggerthella sinensis]|uniref:hypothetical protein n=1 Tax=Eggerthella sinensis TaxID=242230 RepID=UPI0022DEBA76|nr:hypothetical protein [Eggerthella sinensis]